MADDLRIQRYREADRDGVVALLRAGFSDQYANRLIEHWDWKYDAHPLNRQAEQARRINREKLWPFLIKSYSAQVLAEWGLHFEPLETLPDEAPYILLFKDGDRVVAMEGVLPQAFLINGTTQLVAVQSDLSVHPDYRGESLSTRLGLRVVSEHGLVLGWFNMSSRALRLRALRRFTRRRRLSTTSRWSGMPVAPMVKPIDWAYLARRVTGIGMLGSAASAMAAGAHRMRPPLGREVTMPGVYVFQVESFDHRIDDFWRRCSREHSVIAVRDQNYLNWRFGSRPGVSYTRLVATRNANILGYLVYRIAEQEGGRWGYVVDFLVEADDMSVFELMLREAEARMTQEGIKGIVCLIAMPPYRGVLRRRGFYPAFFRAPSLLAASVTSSDPELRVYGEVRKWFVTAGDGDMEMSF